jgi:Carboxypeptidase regulatory-like domain
MSDKTGSLALIGFVLFSSVVLLSQGGATGTILGTILDNSGAVVTGATVTVTNVATGVSNQTRSGSSGDYTVPFLQPGTYKITVEAQGFQQSVLQNVGLVVAQEARANFTLKPGAVSESVSVEASAVSLDTDSSAVSQTVTQKQVDQLPLNGRNFVSLLFIGAGAVQTNGEQGQMRQGEGNAISINGGRPTSNNYTLDGLINTDTALNTPAVILSQDAIQEFKIQSETYSAEYGFSANQVNIVSKSGSNQLHGTAFEFLRNDAFDAKAPLQSAKPELRQNQFGFVLGGPIYIPKVYDGRNKTFFMVNYEGWRIRNGINQNTFDVPIPAQLSGDFSASGLTPVTAGCVPSATQACLPIDPNTGAPFPGNTIPSTRFSKLAQVELAAGLFPAPNCVGCTSGFNYRLVTTLPNTTDQQTYRLDQELGRFGKLFFRYTTAEYSNQNINGSVSIPFGVGVFNEKSESWMISYTKNLGSRMVNNFRFGRLEPIAIQGGVAAPDADVSALGLTGTFQNLPAYARLYPTVSFQGITNSSFGSQGNDTTTSDIPTWQFSDSLTMIHGRHTTTAGFDFRKWLQKRDLSSDFLGGFGFNNDTILNNKSGCTNPGQNCGTGNAVADFLLGYYNGASTFQPGPFSPTNVAGNLNQYRFLYFAPFVQDDWKATNRLTVNLGLRWDYRAVPTEKDNKMFWFDRANSGGGLCFADKGLETQTVSGLGGPIAPSGNGFYRYCGRPNPAAGSKKPFAPRIGLAYRLGDKTVIRGGYGIFFDSSETREIDDSGDIYPFVVRANDNPTTDVPQCGTPGFAACQPKLTDNMFPAVPLHQVTAAQDGSQFFAVIISEFPHNPYVQQWSFSVQRELAHNTTLEANYVGNKGTHLLNRINIGQPLPPSDPALCTTDLNAGIPFPTTGPGSDCPVSARRPFSNVTSSLGFLDSQWNGYSNYNAGNLKLERRSSSIALLAVYTWSKSLDDKSAAAGVGSTNAFAGHMDEHNPRLDYGPSDFSVSHRFVTSLVYQLPVGRGKRFGNNMNRAADLAVGGWQITGITTFQKGFPFSILCNDNFGLLLSFTQRCNQIGDAGSQHSITHWFNTASFVQPLAGQFGNSRRDIIVGPGINNWDMGIGKDFKFTERAAFQFRAEAFNVFNHHQYGFDPFTSTGIGAPVDNNPNDGAAFGTVTAARPGRILQLGGKFVF